MPHEQMFDDDDPVYLRVREIALKLPGADQKVSHGRPAFFTKNIFTMYGASQKIDGEWIQHPQSVIIKPDPQERLALEGDDRFWVPAYWGPYGWLALDISDATDWQEIAELLEDSYRQTAPKGLVTKLEGS